MDIPRQKQGSRTLQFTMNARTWLESALAITDNERWGERNQHSHGELLLPSGEELEVGDTLEIPHRHALTGYSSHVLDRPGFVNTAGEDRDNSPMIRFKTGPLGAQKNWNGNFGSNVRDVFVDARGRRGIEWGGAQYSFFDNVCVRHSTDAVLVSNGSTRYSIRGLDIENGEPNADTRIGRGLTCAYNRSADISASLHCVDLGLDTLKSESLNVKLTCEKVNTLAISGMGHVVDVNWQWPSDTPFDFRGDQGGVTVRAVFSKLPSETLYYLDNAGTKRVLGTFTPHAVTSHPTTRGSRSVFVEVRTSWSKWTKRTAVNVDVKTWNG